LKEKFSLSPERRTEILEKIKLFFQKERDEQIGDVAAVKVMNFFIDKIGAQFYNLGIQDAYQMMTEDIQDLLSLQK
jgi:uncharacterized protein (DUF2164 family)